MAFPEEPSLDRVRDLLRQHDAREAEERRDEQSDQDAQRRADEDRQEPGEDD
jgi:hypothetical protein